jgi:L-ascorbate metabolism protein UlaG (beta-lactamase superfamily)
MRNLRRNSRIAFAGLLAIVIVIVAVVALRWDRRSDLSEIGWQYAESIEGDAGAVSVTWFGVTSLLFDDGETQILIDGTFTRIPISKILLLRKVYSDIANINFTLANFQINRLAAIVPVNSRYIHAMDIGAIANRTSAVVLGSESSANIARGAAVPVDQYQILADEESRQFGNFTITLIESEHTPSGFGGKPWFPGSIDEPLRQPARIGAWRAGVSYSVLISHPRGTSLVHAGGGYRKNKLNGRSADVVMLGVAGMAELGRSYASEIWRDVVAPTGAAKVFPLHYDDFSEPFGEIRVLPDILDRPVETAAWIDELARAEEPATTIRMLPFAEPVLLYSPAREPAQRLMRSICDVAQHFANACVERVQVCFFLLWQSLYSLLYASRQAAAANPTLQS